MNSYLVGAIVTVLGVIGTYLGIRVTVKGTSKSKEVDAAIKEQEREADAKKDYTAGAITNLENSWEENRDLRKELSDSRREVIEVSDRARKEIDAVWARLTEVREKANVEIEAVRHKAEQEVELLRVSFRLQHAADEEYISLLLQHINERRDPPAPARSKASDA